ncbi:MAG TPA: DUF1566 domain-containing protein, partial [Polyangiaceae bacterium]|nr:DUF1566 domain-containing protein [Polyangiaceae bacterium]
VPTVKELLTIVDPGQFSSSIDDMIFPDTPSSFFWSSTPCAGATGNVWSVVFDIGAPSYAGVLESGYARCVRTGTAVAGDAAVSDATTGDAAFSDATAGDAAAASDAPAGDATAGDAAAATDATAGDATAGDAAAPAGHYTIANGTVYDPGTKLTWQQAISSSTYTQADAATYCSALGLNGATWRVPTVKELLTIVDFTVPSPGPTVDSTAFPGTAADHSWSATPYAGAPGDGWFVSFSTGFSDYGLMSSTSYVRCVH